MNDASAKRSGEVLEAHECVALARCECEGTVHLLRRRLLRTLVSPWLGRSENGITWLEKNIDTRKSRAASSRTARMGLRSRLIREEIIGYRMRARRGVRAVQPVGRPRFRAGLRLRDVERALMLLHEPAREHSGGIFLQPRVQQLADLLAKIGGMTEPRKFVALERIARCREQKLPGRLRPVHGHFILQEGKLG